MVEPQFLGLSKSQWELINSFADWFSAVGTIAAVWISLHLALRVARPQARVSVGLRVMVTPGVPGPLPKFVAFRVVNTGERPLRIVQIGWRVGLWKKRYAVQTYDTLLSSPLPVDLQYGQEAQWFIPLKDRPGELWLEYFARFLMPRYRVSVGTLRGQFFASTGIAFLVRPEPDLRSQLADACRRLGPVVKPTDV